MTSAHTIKYRGKKQNNSLKKSKLTLFLSTCLHSLENFKKSPCRKAYCSWIQFDFNSRINFCQILSKRILQQIWWHFKRQFKSNKSSGFWKFVHEYTGIWCYWNHEKQVFQFQNVIPNAHFNSLKANHVEFIDLYIFKGDKFYTSGILDFKIFQKDINRSMYILYKSGHVSHTIKNYVLGETKGTYDTIRLNFSF